MNLCNISTIFLLLFSICNIRCQEDDQDVFVATHEWQVVKKGQSIPKGLHVRINFETGVTEAKLLDPQEQSDNKAVIVTTDSASKNSMKIINEEDEVDLKEIDKIKKKYKSYEEIKESLSELNLTPKLDSEIITELLVQHKGASTGAVMKILEDLDYLAHQHDNAIEFLKLKGFEEVIYKGLNSTVVEIRRETLKLMGSLIQNNNKPRIYAFETGALATLLRIVSTDPDKIVKIRALSTLSSLLRSFPVAQESFISNGGLSIIIYDLIIEHSFARSDDELSQFYDSIDLKKVVLAHDWCQNLSKVLSAVVLSDRDDHDSIEKCLNAMYSLRFQCGNEYPKNVLVNLKRNYEALAVEDVFYESLNNLCDEILLVANRNIKAEL